jgi:aspartate racemase
MKKIGLIGGMSWESTQVYYHIINESVNKKRGGFHSAKCVLESVDFAEIEELQHKEDWKELCQIMVQAAKNLEKAGAEFIVLCTNTMHLCSGEIRKNTSIPFLHIAATTGKMIQQHKLSKVLLLGTRFTMEKDFYKRMLKEDFQIETIIPDMQDRGTIHRIIYDELVHGIIKTESKQMYQAIINKALKNGAQGVVLGCTDIPLLIQDEDVSEPVFDTTRIHAEMAVEFALE